MIDKDFLLQPHVQSFINEQLHTDIKQLALQKHPFIPGEWLQVLHQIQAKQKSKTKLPTWFNTANILYPPPLSVEQTSSEILAGYKAAQISGNRLADITGGFGIDTYYFSKQFSKVMHYEINRELSEIVAHNIKVLHAENICCIPGDGLQILEQQQQVFDWLYIDPARRGDQKQKVFRLKDCQPNVPEHLETYFKYSPRILLKTAPLLDITAGLQELRNVYKIEIVALHNEVKELLWFLDKNTTTPVKIVATNIEKDARKLSFTTTLQDDDYFNVSQPLTYLYEPFSALLKTGNFNAIGNQFGLYKIAQHSHLYTAENLIDFPGRRFKIQEVIPFQKQQVKEKLEGRKAHITTRNFPLKAEDIRKKFKIHDGGNIYAFFTTTAQQEKTVILTTKI